MSRSRALLTFKRTDVTRAIKAAAAAGIDVGRIEIDRDGKIIMVMTAPATAPDVDETSADVRKLL